MKNIEMPWGIKTVYINGIPIFTVRLRFKVEDLVIAENLFNFKVKKHNGYCYLTASSLDPIIGALMHQVAGKICKEIAKKRFQQKYAWVEL